MGQPITKTQNALNEQKNLLIHTCSKFDKTTKKFAPDRGGVAAYSTQSIAILDLWYMVRIVGIMGPYTNEVL